MKRLLMLMLVVVFVGVCLAEESDAGVFKKGPTYIFGWRRPDRDVKPAPDVKPPLLPPSLSPPTQKEQQLAAMILEVQGALTAQRDANAKAQDDTVQAREVAAKQDEEHANHLAANNSESDAGWFDDSGNKTFATGTAILSLLGLGGAVRFGGLPMIPSAG